MYSNNDYIPIRNPFNNRRLDSLGSIWVVGTTSLLIIIILIFSPLYSENVSYDCSVYENALDHLLKQIKDENSMMNKEETILNSRRRQLDEVVNPCYSVVMEKLDEIVDTLDDIENITLDVLQKTKRLIEINEPIRCGIAKWKDRDNLKVDGCTIEIKDPSQCFFDNHKISKITYLGDSNVMRVAESAKAMMTGIDWGSVNTWNRCETGKLIYGESFVSGYKDNGDTIGPFGYGKKHPGCLDCENCISTISNGKYKDKSVIHEYIAMDYAKDTVLRTDTYETSQDAIIKGYLRKNPPSIVYVSVGSFDIDYVQKMKNTTAWYNNYKYLMKNLKLNLPETQICAAVFAKVWKRNSEPVQEDMVKIQRDVLSEVGIDCVVDGYNLTSSIVGGRKQRKFAKDGLHYPPIFYDTINTIINSHFC